MEIEEYPWDQVEELILSGNNIGVQSSSGSSSSKSGSYGGKSVINRGGASNSRFDYLSPTDSVQNFQKPGNSAYIDKLDADIKALNERLRIIFLC